MNKPLTPITPHEPTDYAYVGGELALFADAIRWKAYWLSKIAPYLGRTVLEVGAGIGGTTEAILKGGRHFDVWHGIEPDASLAAILRQKQAQGVFPDFCTFSVDTTATLAGDRQFDSLVYIDVLEHIEDDRQELAVAAGKLKPGGHLIVLSPAHQSLYSEFDKSIGHYRRYSRRQLEATAPASLRLVASFYLDSVGQLTSLANRFVLRAPLPTPGQIRLWDRLLVPIARVLDPLLGYRFGRSVICVWQRPATDAAIRPV